VAPTSPDEWAGRDPMKWLYIYGVDDLSVSGGGTIDGAGQEWWARSCKRKKTQVRAQPPVNQHPTCLISSELSTPNHDACVSHSCSPATRGLLPG
jgi:hypothetical protein